MKVWIGVFFVVMILIVSGCSGEGGSKKAKTPEEIAKVVVQGLIEGDPKKIKDVVRANDSLTDTYVEMLITNESPKFADKKLEDFTFKSDKLWGEEGFKVLENEEEVIFLTIQKIGDQYYFNGKY